HTTRSFNFNGYSHTGSYPGDHRENLECKDCHTTNSEVIPWRFPYAPSCAGCHANEYEADEHKKTKNPRIYYTVSELSDCSGACHEYTDSTFTTIKKTRYGEHKVSDGDFD
ncbi:MAG: hypothetical protein HRT35_28765, partial [Algicola sp.]|nr:hypothetical protein [Algicola sp.]